MMAPSKLVALAFRLVGLLCCLHGVQGLSGSVLAVLSHYSTKSLFQLDLADWVSALNLPPMQPRFIHSFSVHFKPLAKQLCLVL